MIYLLFIVGLALLIKGADWLVIGAKNIASKIGISDFIIGLTIVSMGTSMPELLVSVVASVEGNPGLATGNVLGSNIANILLVLGGTAIIKDLPVRRSTILSEVPFSLAAALLVGFLANSCLWYEDSDDLELSRGDGIIIFFFFLLFMIYVLNMAMEDKQDTPAVSPEKVESPFYQNFLYILVGSGGLFLGGKWVVDGAVHLAGILGMSDAFIGLTIVAFGTSLPELVTSILSALKNDTDIAVGNAIGSNIFNLLWILSISSMIQPLPFDVASNSDIMMVITASSLILLALILGRRLIIKRIEGIFFLLVYAVYIYFLIQRG